MSAYTLLFAADGFFQSYCTDSKFNYRRTQTEPSRSAIIGMVAGALGVTRTEKDKLQYIDDKLRMGIRVDQEGELINDLQIAENEKDKDLFYRTYLSDAKFLVALESEDKDFLNLIAHALKFPVFPLYLGKRSCIANIGNNSKIRPFDAYTALTTEPLLCNNPGPKRLIIEENNGMQFLRDRPISFDSTYRTYGFRRVEESRVVIGSQEHDPFDELESEE